jgi:organic radical activating enzyme
MQITFRDYVKTFPKLEKEFDNAAMCAMKWIYLYVHLGEGVVKGCHNVPHRYVTSDDIAKYGKDLFTNSEYEINTRREKLNNIKNPECQRCWSSESKNVRSCRLPEPYYKMHRDRFPEITNDLTPMPTMIEIAFNNTCDLKCIYCSSTFSSQWQTEDKKFNIVSKQQAVAPEGFEDIFWQWLEQDGSNTLLQYYILGGEPLIQPEFYNFIDRFIPLIKANPNKFNVKPELVILTNGHTPEKYLTKWFEKIKELNEVVSIQFHISIEGYGNKAEYIRTNLDWDRFSSNVDKILEFSKSGASEIRFSITHSAMSITSCLDLLQWIKKLSDKHSIDVDLIRTSVVTPEHLAPCMLTPNFNTYIDEVCSWIETDAPKWNHYIDFLKGIGNSFGKHSVADLKKFIAWEQDMVSRRNFKTKETFPELATWLEYCNEN